MADYKTGSGSVNIYARLRKIMPWEDPTLSARAIDNKTILNRTSKREQAYEFTHVFVPSDSNIECFENIGKPLLQNVLTGYNAILMAYGQTGSGKTYSILGKIHHQVKGLLTLSLEYLLNESAVSYVELSAVETFGHHIQKIRSFDLGNIENQIQEWDKKQPMKSSSNIRKHAAKIRINKRNIQSTISKLHSSSHFAPTGKNPESSRGHICYVTTVYLQNNIVSYWIVVDLAGSEGESAITKEFQLAAQPSEVMARRLEAWCINHGLSQLQVIFNEMLGLKKKGASQGIGLKKTLSEFINQNSYISVLFTISPSQDNNKSTEATLRFAESAALVKCTPVKQEKKINKGELIKELKQCIEKQDLIIKEKNKRITELEKRPIANNNNNDKDNEELSIMKNIKNKLSEFEASIDEEKDKENIWHATKSQFLSFEDEEELEQSMKDQMSDIRRASRVSADVQFVSQILQLNEMNNVQFNEEIFNNIKHSCHSSITSIQSNMLTINETDDENSSTDEVNEYRINKIFQEYENGYELHTKSLQNLNKNELLYLCTKLSHTNKNGKNINSNKNNQNTDKIIESHEKQIQYLTKELNQLHKYHKQHSPHTHSLSLESDMNIFIAIDTNGIGTPEKDKSITEKRDKSPSSSRIDPMAALTYQNNHEHISFINQNDKQLIDCECDDEKINEHQEKKKINNTGCCTDNCIIL